tara:strand:- start:4096 stop:4482 length:387 start_codon:yes stop_codon:yes gene_type:complete
MMYVNKYREYPNSCIVLYVPERDNIFEGVEGVKLTASDTTIDGDSVLDNERENIRERGEITDEDRRETVLSSLTPEQRDVIEEVQVAFQDPNTDSDTLQGLMDDFIFNGPMYSTGYDIYERSLLEGNP